MISLLRFPSVQCTMVMVDQSRSVQRLAMSQPGSLPHTCHHHSSCHFTITLLCPATHGSSAHCNYLYYHIINISFLSEMITFSEFKQEKKNISTPFHNHIIWNNETFFLLNYSWFSHSRLKMNCAENVFSSKVYSCTQIQLQILSPKSDFRRNKD